MINIEEQSDNLLKLLDDISVSVAELSRPKDNPAYDRVLKAVANLETPISAELEALQDNLPDEVVTPTTLPNATHTTVDFYLWETLAYDLALANMDDETIAIAYGVTPEQLEALKANSYFKSLLQAKKDEVAQIGSGADFVVKMRMAANKATTHLINRLTHPMTSNKDFHTMFKTVVELAKLLPVENDNANQPTVGGASITFNIQGVPGLEHLTPKETVVTVEAEDIVDVEFSDVKGGVVNPVDDLEVL